MSIIQTTDTVQTLLLKSGAIIPTFTDNRVLDINAIDWNSLKRFVSHDTTSVTKAVKQIQKELAMSLLFVSEDIKKTKLLQYDEKDVQNIYDIFRNHIQRAYQIGIAYVNNIFNSKGFIDSEDLKIIRFMSEYYTQVFLNNIDKILFNPKFILNLDRLILDINENRLSSRFNYLTHSVSATFQALQISTIVKTIVLAYDKSSSGPIGPSSSSAPSLQFKWVKSMGDTCPICNELNGKTWNLEEWNEIPMIPHAVHPSCKCRVMVIQTDSF